VSAPRLIRATGTETFDTAADDLVAHPTWLGPDVAVARRMISAEPAQQGG